MFGGAIVLVGVLFLLQNLGYLYVGSLWKYWPVILIAIGIAKLVEGPGTERRMGGLAIALIGAVLLTNMLGFLPWMTWRMLWPLWLIFWGILILTRGFGRNPFGGPGPFTDDTGTSAANTLDEKAIFGGVHRRVEAQDFQGGLITAVFGGVEIDLRNAATTKDEIQLEANAVFGGIELKVPEAWDVTVRGAGVLGAYEDRTHPARPVEGVKRPRLVIRGSAVFGGVEVRN
jgi:predicted membrane protein